ncbi:MAG: hypothetical protein M0C28_00295 [Candidatus Moduliflexus flocculans]|nr:hypothetical protein [Candidatus Moduliflexus flocculans]
MIDGWLASSEAIQRYGACPASRPAGRRGHFLHALCPDQRPSRHRLRGRNEAKRSVERIFFALSAVFFLGMAATFTALGVAASLLGKLMGTSSPWWFIALGILMPLMALQVLGWSSSPRPTFFPEHPAGLFRGLSRRNPRRVFLFSCKTPVLVVLLGLVAKRAGQGASSCCCSIPSGTAYLSWRQGHRRAVAKIASSEKSACSAPS